MRKRLLIWSFLCGIIFVVSAQSTDEAHARQRINAMASTLQSMQCDFVQTKHLKMLNDRMVSKGRLYYQQSDKLRWEYISPYTYIFILNKDKVVLRNKNHNDVIDVNQNKVFKEIARIMMNSVVGNCLSDERNFETSLKGTDSQWVVTLLPLRKDMKQMFEKIVLYFSRQKSMVSMVELFEKNGDRTVIELKNMHSNEPIATKMFSIN